MLSDVLCEGLQFSSFIVPDVVGCASVCQAAVPAGRREEGTTDAASSAELALATLQAGLADERRQWEEELTDGGTLLRLADAGHASGDAPDEAGRALVRPLNPIIIKP